MADPTPLIRAIRAAKDDIWDASGSYDPGDRDKALCIAFARHLLADDEATIEAMAQANHSEWDTLPDFDRHLALQICRKSLAALRRHILGGANG